MPTMTETKTYNSQPEQAVIGSLLIDSAACAEKVFDYLQPEEFYSRCNGAAYKTLREMWREGVGIDLVTFTDRLKADKVEVGGSIDLYGADALSVVGATSNVFHYAKIIKDGAVRRRIQAQLAEITPDASPEQMEKLTALVTERDLGEADFVVRPQDFLVQSLEDLAKGRRRAFKTGFAALDHDFNPQTGDLVVISARTNVGKTTFMASLLDNLITKHVPCLMVPTETRPEQFAHRLIGMRAGIPAWRFRSGQFEPGDYEKMQTVAGDLYSSPLTLMDLASPTIGDIKRAVKVHHPHILLIDYLGRCSTTKEVTRAREIEKFVVELKNLCVRESVLCFLAVQLARRTDFDVERPKLADLSDSSAIEKEADAVVCLWRAKKERTCPNGQKIIEAAFLKNRFGSLTEWTMSINTRSMRMTDVGPETV